MRIKTVRSSPQTMSDAGGKRGGGDGGDSRRKKARYMVRPHKAQRCRLA
jgi:hypothetical protein